MPEIWMEVLKNLVSRPATLNYPFEKSNPMPGTRGALSWDMNKCDQCQDCERVCPSMAIKVFPEEKKVEYYPFKCLFCYYCIENCMQQAIIGSEVVRAPETSKVVETFEVSKN